MAFMHYHCFWTCTLVFLATLGRNVLVQAVSRQDYRVHGLEEIVPAFADFDGLMYAGLMPVDHRDRHGSIMFWLFVPHHPSVPDTLTLWLNGGPGCSSFSVGLLAEHSPVTIAPRPAGYCCSEMYEPLQYNRYAWTNATVMLYVEQPVGVGFSIGGPEPIDEDDVADDMYQFFQNFYNVFDDLLSHELYVVGESYAGMYAPSIARRIYLENAKESATVRMNLAGVALGNGWVDPKVQGPATIDYAYWHGLIDSYARDNLHAEWEHCMKNTGHDEPGPPFHPFNVPDDCSMMEAALLAAGAHLHGARHTSGPNTYDVTTWDPYSMITHGDTALERFYNDPRVKEKLHAPTDVEWRGCIEGAGRRRRHRSRQRRTWEQSAVNAIPAGRRDLLLLDHDRPISTAPYLAELLDGGIRVLVYNGDRDLSTCAQGSEMYLNDMEWDGDTGWYRASRGLWVTNQGQDDEAVAGYSKEHLGLSFVVVYNSGHLVPYNQPRAGLDLITRFLTNETFMDFELPSFDFNLSRRHQREPAPVAMYAPPPPPPPPNASSPVESVWGEVWHSLSIMLIVLLSFGAGFWTSARNNRRKDYEPITDNGVNLM